MMTKDEAKEFFRLWPTWRAKNAPPGEVVTIVDVEPIWAGISDGTFSTYMERVDDLASSHIPRGSWWYRPNGNAARVLTVKRPDGFNSLVNTEALDDTYLSNGGIDGISTFLQTNTRITPENFKWHESASRTPICAVCSNEGVADLHTHVRDGNCGKLLLAVFGSYARADQAFRRRHVTGKAQALLAEKKQREFDDNLAKWGQLHNDVSTGIITTVKSLFPPIANTEIKGHMTTLTTCIQCGVDIINYGTKHTLCGDKCRTVHRAQAKIMNFAEGVKVRIPFPEHTLWTREGQQAVMKELTVVPPVDAANWDQMIGRADRSNNKPITIKLCVCGKAIAHADSHTHASFCSSGCAANAAATYKTADRALRFLAGLNLQDHSIKEQREAVDVTRALVKVLRPEAK